MTCNALKLLLTITHDNKEAWPIFHKNKSIESLVKVLKQNKLCSKGIKETLASLINISVDSKDNERRAQKTGVLPILEKLKGDRNPEIAKDARKAHRYI